MRIVNGKKFYQKQIDKCVKIDGDGWNTYNGSNYQWYTLLYNPECGLVILDADNSGDCNGNYTTEYYSSPEDFMERCGRSCNSVEKLLGDIDEENEALMKFVELAFSD